MTPLERLKLAVGLVHAVPGAEMSLTTDGGDSVLIGRRPAADVDPCVMRRIVIASQAPGQPNLSAHVVDIAVGGVLHPVDAGSYVTRYGERQQHWIPTLLPAGTVSELLDDVGSGVVPEGVMSARLVPDTCLGVTLLQISTDDSAFDHALDAIAVEAAAACFVAELAHAAMSTPSGERIAGDRS